MHSQENPSPVANPTAERGRGRQTLALLILGWVGIALTIAFVHGLIAQPTGLILMGLMLAFGWTLVTLIFSWLE